jgi:hypothetical protein
VEVNTEQSYNDFLSYLSNSPVELPITKTLSLMGYLNLFEEISINWLASAMDISNYLLRDAIFQLNELEIIETYIDEVENISLVYSDYSFDVHASDLDAEDIKLLAFLFSVKNISYKSINLLFGLSKKEFLNQLSKFAFMRFIYDYSEGPDQITYKITNSLNQSNVINQTQQHIIGLILAGVDEIRQISDFLLLPLDVILLEISYVILFSDMKINYEYNEKTSELYTQVRLDKISNQIEEIELLSRDKRFIIGYIALSGRSSLTNIAHQLKKSIFEVTIDIAELMYDYSLQLTILPNSSVYFKDYPKLRNVIPFDQLKLNSLFNYNALLGILQNQKTNQISLLARKLRTNEREVIQRVVDLYFTGLINGNLIKDTQFKLLREQSKITYNKKNLQALSRREKIIIGALIAGEKLNWVDIGWILKIDREMAIEIAFTLLSKFPNQLIISKGKLLEKVVNIQIPPLEQISELSTSDKIIIGYLVLNNNTHLSKIEKLLKIKRRDLIRQIYYLLGSGLIIGEVKKNRVEITRFRIDQPIHNHSLLPDPYPNLGKIVLSKDENEFSLNHLSEALEMHKNEVIKYLSIFIAMGYCYGKLEKNKFQRTSLSETKKDVASCLYCNHIMHMKSRTCANCLLSPPRCIICRGQIYSTEKIVQCSHCSSYSHKNHMKEWLTVTNRCPLCKNVILENNLVVPEFQ